jgi:UDP-N-acetylmuramyl pentapeptide phosphotransferase/UDP-N-acetylglucosamine-1-phosphate transferase
MIEHTIGRLPVLAPAVFVALLLALGMTVLLRPSLARHAMAAPNARSSRVASTPQGGGIAVVAVAWLLATFARGRR